MRLFRKEVEPDSKTITEIYNRITEIKASITEIKAENDAMKRKLHSLAGKLYREAYLEEEKGKEKPFIGMQPIYP